MVKGIAVNNRQSSKNFLDKDSYSLNQKKKLLKKNYKIDGNSNYRQHINSELSAFKFMDFNPKAKKYAQISGEYKFDTTTRGLHEKRKTLSTIFSFDSQGRLDARTVDKVTHILYEGASVTLVGSLTYNSSSGSFEMKGLYAIVAGGLNEIIEIMEEELSMIKIVKWICFFASLGFFGILYLKNKMVADEGQMKEQNQVIEELKKSKTKYMPEKFADEGYCCLICQVKTINIITHPCNHFATCKDCYIQHIENRPNRLQQAQCIVCRQAISDDITVVSYNAQG